MGATASEILSTAFESPDRSYIWRVRDLQTHYPCAPQSFRGKNYPEGPEQQRDQVLLASQYWYHELTPTAAKAAEAAQPVVAAG